MTMLRMPIAQPPNITRKRDAKGMIQWATKSVKKSHERVGSRLKPYPPDIGKIRRLKPRTKASTIPSHMYGVAVRMYPIGRTALSIHFRRAAIAPKELPAHQLRRMAGTSRASV